MQITKEQLDKFVGYPVTQEMYDGLVQACEKYSINTPNRIACFLGQCAVESGSFTHLEENLNYRAQRLKEVWPKLYNDSNVAKYASNPKLIASRSYAGIIGNGDEMSQDGWKYRGRGVIQLTGKANYLAYARASGIDVLNNPDQVATMPVAMLSAGHYWHSRDLNQYADKLDFASITKRVNAGMLGHEDRVFASKKMLAILL